MAMGLAHWNSARSSKAPFITFMEHVSILELIVLRAFNLCMQIIINIVAINLYLQTIITGAIDMYLQIICVCFIQISIIRM